MSPATNQSRIQLAPPSQTEKENDTPLRKPAVKQYSINSLIIKEETVKADIHWPLNH